MAWQDYLNADIMTAGRQKLTVHGQTGDDLDFKASQEGLALRGFQPGHGAGQQAGEDGPKVLVHLHPAGMQRLPLLLIQLADHLLNLVLVHVQNLLLLGQLGILSISLLKHGQHLQRCASVSIKPSSTATVGHM